MMDYNKSAARQRNSANDNVEGFMNAPACPRCGQAMRLSRIEPRPGDAVADEITYECTCGATSGRVVKRRG